MTRDLIYTLKVGDKIICNKSYTHGTTYRVATEKSNIEYNIGDVYTISTIYDINKNYTYPIHGKNINNFEHGFSMRELETNWIILAMWRDEQINSILDD